MKELRDRERKELERIAQLTTGEAHRQILEQSEAEVRHEFAGRVRQIEEEAASEAKRRARNLVADALQRVAASATAETTVTLVELPSDDMKGRIIMAFLLDQAAGVPCTKASITSRGTAAPREPLPLFHAR